MIIFLLKEMWKITHKVTVMEEILKVLPIEIKEKVKNKLDGLEEIRIRVNKPVILQYGQDEEILHYIID